MCTVVEGMETPSSEVMPQHTFNHGLVALAWLDGEGPVLDVSLYAGVLELAADEALGVKDCVDWVHGHLCTGRGFSILICNTQLYLTNKICLVLGRVTNEALCISEAHIRGRRAVA